MKRTATLLAGLLLVTGTVFAEGVQVTAAHVEGTYWLTNSQYGSLGSEGGDLDLEVKVEKEGKFGTLGLVLQNDIDDDTDLRITYSKTEGDWTVATEALLIDANGDLLGQGNTGTSALLIDDNGVLYQRNIGTSGNMNKGDGTYISWDVMGSKMFKLTYYPYEVGGMSWDEETLETFIGFGMPGMKLDVKVNANTSVALKLATDNGDSKAENEYAYKAELSTKVGKASIKAAAGVGTVTDSQTWSKYKDDGTYLKMDSNGVYSTDATYDSITFSTKTEKTVLAAQLKMPIAKFDILAEANMETMETVEFSNNTVKTSETDTTAFYLKGSYNMGTYNKYSVTPYASVEITDTEVKIAGKKSATKSDTVTDLEAGVELKQGSFTITPKVVVNKADDNKKYLKEDGDATSNKKTATAVGVKFAYSM